ncbi:carbohydrate deacetylase [Romboutsia sp.]|uniref:carbohydrate deacetylase n=1 Tax=Romboutsia sp. TaxID=1965302 RepID=UPI003F3AF08B
MTRLIINADDFGYCESVNYGIISAFKNGIVRSTTTMANMPGFEHAMELLKENKGLGCGVHMTLSCYKPVLGGLKTIIDGNGMFFKRITNEDIEKMDLEEIYQEFCAQIEKVKAKTEITHLDSHHHVHTLKSLQPVIERIVEKYELPIRGGFEYDLKYSKIIPMVETFYGDNVGYEYFENNIEELKKYEVVDIMSHPAYLDEFILGSTSYAIPRTKEYSILTSEKIKEFVGKNFNLCNYKEI